MRTRSVAASAALSAVVVGLVACSAGGDAPTGSSTDTTKSTPSSAGSVAEWSIELDSRPTGAAVGTGVVYVSSAGGTRFPPQLYAIDLASGQVLEQRTATGQPYDLLVASDGRLWAAGDRHPDQAGGAGVNVHDPASLRVTGSALEGGPAFSLALVGADMWVGGNGQIGVLDPITLGRRRSLPIGGPAYQLVVLPNEDGVIAVEGDRLERLGPDGTPMATLPVAADGSIVVVATSNRLWVRVPVGADSTLLVVDQTLASPAQEVGVDTDSAGGGLLATAAGDVVLVDDRRDVVLCLPGGTPPAVSTTADDLVGVLAELADHRLLFATSTGLAARTIAC